MPFLVMLVFWLTVIFTSFGLFPPRNATVITVLLVCALSAAGSLFLILELDTPYEGLIKVSSAPLAKTLVRGHFRLPRSGLSTKDSRLHSDCSGPPSGVCLISVPCSLRALLGTFYSKERANERE